MLSTSSILAWGRVVVSGRPGGSQVDILLFNGVIGARRSEAPQNIWEALIIRTMWVF